jgi:hypothetical protein
MIYEPGHPNITPTDWQAFRRDRSPYRFGEVIDRSELDLPDWFVPLARGVVMPSDFVLDQVGCRPGSRRPCYWKHPTQDVFHFNQGQWGLTVERIGEFWMAKRWERPNRINPVGLPDEVLVLPFGSTPIFTRTYQPIMRLAQRCRWTEPQPFGYKWVTILPVNSEGAIRFANERRIQEISDCKHGTQQANSGPFDGRSASRTSRSPVRQ